MTLELWNMMENKLVAQAMEVVLPFIKVNEIVYLP